MDSSDKNRRGQLHSIIDRLIVASAGKADNTETPQNDVKSAVTENAVESQTFDESAIESLEDKRKKKRKGEPRQLISSEAEIITTNEEDIPVVVIHMVNNHSNEMYQKVEEGEKEEKEEEEEEEEEEDEFDYENEPFVVNAADVSDYEVDEEELLDSDDSYEPEVKRKGRKRTKKATNTKKKTKKSKEEMVDMIRNCEYCNEIFNTEKSYKSHLQKHAHLRPFKCSICDKGFKRQSHVKRHEILHTGEKPYVCNICGRGFTQGPHLKSHLQTHAGDELFQQKELERQKPKANNTKVVDKNKCQSTAKSEEGQDSESTNNENGELTIFECTFCGFKFTSEKQLKNHLQKHANQRPFKCKTCDKPFKQMNHLRRHEIIHTGARPYVCHICDKGFTQSAHLKAHIRIHTGERPYKCKFCDRGFIDYSQCRRHIMTHTGQRPFPCDVCGRAFSQRSNLLKHQQTQHNGEKKAKEPIEREKEKEEKTEIKQEISTETETEKEKEKEKEKENPAQIKRKENSQAKQYTCDVCGKDFPRGSNLRAHMVFHNGVRPHKCEHCGKGFYQSSHYKRHLLIHTGDRPFVCDVCGRGFTQSPHLYAHRRIHTGETPYECKTCGKKFKDNSCFRRHERTHSGEKEYECQDCGKKFTQRTGLVRHIRVHTGERPYACQYCCKSFKDGSHLRKHVLSKICRPHMKDEQIEETEELGLQNEVENSEIKSEESEAKDESLPSLVFKTWPASASADKIPEDDADAESNSVDEDNGTKPDQMGKKLESDEETYISENGIPSPRGINILENENDTGIHIGEVFSLCQDASEISSLVPRGNDPDSLEHVPGEDEHDSLGHVPFDYGWPADLSDSPSF